MAVRSAQKSKKISAKRRKGFSWKKTRAAKKVKRKIRLLFFAVLSLILTTLLLTAFSIYKFIKAPLVSANLGALEKEVEWNGVDDLNIVFLVTDGIDKLNPELKSVYILKIVPQSKSYFILNIPVSSKVDLAERYGTGDLTKAFSLGDIKLVQKTIFKQLAIYPNSYVLMDEEGILDIKEMFGEVDLRDIRSSVPATKLYLNVEFFKFLKTHIRTDLTVSEIFRVFSFVRGVNTVNGKVFEINEESFMQSEWFDAFWEEYILSSFVSEENIRIMVLNGAEIPGLATWGGRVVENGGLALLSVGNTEKKYEESFLVSDDIESQTVQKLARLFNISVIKTRDVVGDDSAFLRGDIVVVLGLDIGNVL
ncbi:MAG: LCP family protein [bacterium]